VRQVPDMATKSNIQPLMALLLVIFLDSFAYFLVIPVFLHLFFHDDLGLIPKSTSLSARNMWYSVAITLPALAGLLTAPLIGYLSDKYGRKRIILACLMATSIGFILPLIGTLSKSLSLILIGRLMTGVATGNQPVAQAAIADFSSGKQKAIYLGWIAFVMTLALMLGPLVGGYLSDNRWGSGFNIQLPYEAGIGVSILSIILLVFFFREGEKKDRSLSTKFPLSSFVKKVFWSGIGGLFVVFFLLELAFSQYYQAIPLYLSQRYHYTATHTASFLSYTGWWMLLGLMFYPLVIRYVDVRKIAVSSIVLASVGFIICAGFPEAWGQWLGVGFMAVFIGATYSALLALISHYVSLKHAGHYQGTAMGIAGTLLQGAWMITAFLSGWLTNISLPLPLWLAMGAILGAAFFLGLSLFLLRSKSHDHLLRYW
jgi:DHA1 family tetracycline resistance protein-like MFS transporter